MLDWIVGNIFFIVRCYSRSVYIVVVVGLDIEPWILEIESTHPALRLYILFGIIQEGRINQLEHLKLSRI